jgi:SAM-dependent methyltransferase
MKSSDITIQTARAGASLAASEDTNDLQHAPTDPPGANARSSPERYDAWYRSPRGQWIGQVEFELLLRMLRPAAGERLLDVGCGTGYFTRRLAREAGVDVTGVDPDLPSLAFARSNATRAEHFVASTAERLPFDDQSFDRTLCVTALCFMKDPRRALDEMLRVTRKRLVLGLLNRHSLLYLEKGRQGGVGSYRGARWHTAQEARLLFDGLPVSDIEVRSAVFVPAGGSISQAIEGRMPQRCLFGGFLAVGAGRADQSAASPDDRCPVRLCAQTVIPAGDQSSTIFIGERGAAKKRSRN